MISLIADDYRLIQVMSRFGIRMGIGDKTIMEVCEDSGVDCHTFLTVVNYVTEGFPTPEDFSSLSIRTLLHYLRQSHIYFLEYSLPSIRRKILDGIKLRTSDVSFLILKFFDEYYTEVRTHMEAEETMLFSYINSLLEGHVKAEGVVATYSDQHENVSSKLKELKTIIIKFSPEDATANLLNDALYDIYRCEEELENHCSVEDNILMPVLSLLEKGEYNGDSEKR
ncbi:MAG: hemerythrin domain-containing protein [Muribaculaceae bacterium]|nr:hemerythrin domain-containing protein [Muribaculaceae bacterium]